MLHCLSRNQENDLIEFKIDAMTCGHCVRTVTQAVQQADPQAHVTVDLPAHRVQVDTAKTREAIAAVLAAAGYPPG
jgi:copper chaperone